KIRNSSHPFCVQLQGLLSRGFFRMEPARRNWLSLHNLLHLGSLFVIVLLAGVLLWENRGLLSRPAPAPSTEPVAAAPDPAAVEQNAQIFRDENDIVPPLKEQLLARVVDSRPLPVFDTNRLNGTKEEDRLFDEIQAYFDAVDKGYRLPAHSFANTARRDVTY